MTRIVLHAPAARAGRDEAVVDVASGARVASWRVDGRELLVTAGRTPEAWGCYPLVPWGGRIRDGRFVHGGRTVELPRPDGGPHALHGVGYRSGWSVVATADDAVVLDLALDPATGWPLGGSVRQEIRVGPGALHLSMTVTAGDDAMPVVVGWHPWFVRVLDGAAGHLVLPPGDLYVRGADGLPTGEVVPRPPDPPAGHWDDCLTDLRGPVGVRWPGVGEVRVDRSPDDGVPGDPRAPLDDVVVFDGDPPGLCVEPQSGPPDAVNLVRATVLEPGRSLVVRTALVWAPDATAGSR